MANTDRPQGFRVYGEPNKIVILEAGSAVYPGEFVRMASDGQIDAVAAGETILGLCLDYGSAAGVKVRVSYDPDQIYIGQADETEIDAQTDVGNLFDVVATAENTTYKASRMEIDSSTASTTSGQLVLLGLDTSTDNAFGTNASCFVKVNEHQLITSFAGV